MKNISNEELLKAFHELDSECKTKIISYCKKINKMNHINKFLNSTPIFIGITSGLFSFLVLPIMPLHPISIPASFGFGLSMSIIFFSIRTGIRRIGER